METKNFQDMNRDELNEAFDAWVEKEKANGLVDIKFCVESGKSSEDAMRQLLHIHKMEENGETRPYSDY